MSNNKEIWGERLMNEGYAKIPHILRKNRTKLGLLSTEFMVLIDYIDEWHHTKTVNPYPKLMEYSGLCKRSLQKLIESMENKGLLKRVIVSEQGLGDTGFWLDLSPLLIKLNSLVSKSIIPPDDKAFIPPGVQAFIPSTKNKDKEKEKESTTKEKEKESSLQKDFKKFWEEYPRKKSKGDAEKAWKQIKPSPELVEKIVSKLALLKCSQQWLREGGEFIPYPATWLRAKGWEDEVGTRSVAPGVASVEPDDTELAREQFYKLNYQRAKDEVLKDYEDEEDFNRFNSPMARSGLIGQKLWDLFAKERPSLARKH